MQLCGATVKWSGEQMTRDLISHKFGSLTWQNTGYESWQDQRKRMYIDHIVNIIWRTEPSVPKGDAETAHMSWVTTQSEYYRWLKPDYVCRDYMVGMRFNKMLYDYDRLPLNVMRAHVCKLLFAYIDGGVYMDLDVRPGRQVKMQDWLDIGRDFIFGWEKEGLVADWFFATKAKLPQIKCMIDKYAAYIKAPVTVKTADDVSEITGQKAFSRTVLACGFNVTLSVEDMHGGKLKHERAYDNWKTAPMEYRSWAKEATRPAIPQRLIYVWLGPRTNANHILHRAWRFQGMEPAMQQTWLDDPACMALADTAGITEPYRKLREKTPVGAARLCGVMAVEAQGGVYMDYDVEYKEHFTAWLDLRPEAQIVLGDATSHANEAGVAPWIFAAVAQHPCLTAIREAVVARIAAGELGPAAAGVVAFADGARKCGAPLTLSNEMISKRFVVHAAKV